MLDQAIMENIISCKSKLLKEGISLLVSNTSSLVNGYDLPIQGYQGKKPYYARPSYHGKHHLMQVQATQGRVLLFNPSYHEMMWPHQVKLS
ncbi:hypothetical protein H5410_004334, partial [Solanum commersonii]